MSVANMTGTLALGLILVALQGCVPDFSSYDQPEIPNAIFYKDLCAAGSGSPSVAYYPFHNIYVSLSVNPVRLGLHLPEGTSATLDGDVITVKALTSEGPIAIRSHIQLARHGSLGRIDPDPFLGLPDPYSAEVGLGPLSGASIGGKYIWYLYVGTSPEDPNRPQLVPLSLSGTMELPPMTVNGLHYPAQIIPFSKKRNVGVLPVNC